MLLLKARQLLPQLAFFIFGHRHRWSLRPALGYRGEGSANYRVFHKAIQGSQKIFTNQ